MARKRFLLDYEVEAHSCLKPPLGEVRTTHPLGHYEIHISNLAVDPGIDRPLLSVQLIIEAESLEEAKETGPDILRRYLHMHTFATNSSFSTHRLKRIADWSPGLIERECLYFAEHPTFQLPHRVLTEEVFRSVELLETAERSPIFARVLRYFANGVSSIHTDDQFQFFYFVLELIARMNKGDEVVHDQCARCHQPLYCETCKNYPTHKPYPKQAIQMLIDKTVSGDPKLFFKTINKIRNALLHGEAPEVIEEELGVTLSDVVDQIGGVAWVCIYNTFMSTFQEQKLKGGPLALLQTNKFCHQTLIVTSHITQTVARPDVLTIGDLPEIKLQINIFGGGVTRARSAYCCPNVCFWGGRN